MTCMLRDFRTYQLALKLHKTAKKLRVPDYLKDQLLRASSSIVMNIAEGSGKPTPKDQKRFYGIAMGSLRETIAILDMLEVENKDTLSLTDQLGACLYTLIRK